MLCKRRTSKMYSSHCYKSLTYAYKEFKNGKSDKSPWYTLKKKTNIEKYYV